MIKEKWCEFIFSFKKRKFENALYEVAKINQNLLEEKNTISLYGSYAEWLNGKHDHVPKDLDFMVTDLKKWSVLLKDKSTLVKAIHKVTNGKQFIVSIGGVKMELAENKNDIFFPMQKKNIVSFPIKDAVIPVYTNKAIKKGRKNIEKFFENEKDEKPSKYINAMNDELEEIKKELGRKSWLILGIATLQLFTILALFLTRYYGN